MESFREARNWLDQLKSEAQFFRKSKKPSLSVVEKILDSLGRPDYSFEWRVMVGGTAGKGTVCAYTEQTLLDYGKKVAVLSSPHLQIITERIRINGRLISQKDFEKSVLEIKKHSEKINEIPTFYEVIILAGIWSAKKANCKILVAEIGMGGRLDAVNAIQGKRISILTFVGTDHLEFFEDSVDKLAEEKAGIFTKDSVLNLSYDKKYGSILNKISNREVVFVKGIRNKLNKKIARKACEKIITKNDFVMTRRILPCRWEKIITKEGKQIILEGAHSEPRFKFILPKLKKITEKKIAIFAMTKNHNPEDFKIILDYFDAIIWTKISGERGFWNPEILAEKFKKGIVENDPQKAFEKAQKKTNKIIVLGSFYLCGKIRENFYASKDILKQQTEFPD